MNKLSNRFLAVLSLFLIALTITSVVDIILTAQSSWITVVATKLDEEPETYFVIDDPGTYFLEAVSNCGETVFWPLEYTEIDDLMVVHGCNVAYLGEFYAIGYFSDEKLCLGSYLLHGAVLGWALLIVYIRTPKKHKSSFNRLLKKENSNQESKPLSIVAVTANTLFSSSWNLDS